MPVLPGAEPFRHDGGEVGVLLCHGFTGSPQSLRPWAEYLAERGLTVVAAAAARPRHPLAGHAAHRLAGLVRRGGPRAARSCASAAPGLRLRPVDGRRAGPAAGREARRRDQRDRPGQPGEQGCTAPRLRAAGAAASRPDGQGDRQRHRQGGRGEIGYDRVPLHAAHSLRELLPAGRRRTAPGDPAVAAVAQPAGPCRAAGRLRAGPAPGSPRRTSGRRCWSELPRRDAGPRRGADLRGEPSPSSPASRRVSGGRASATRWRRAVARASREPQPTRRRGGRLGGDRRGLRRGAAGPAGRQAVQVGRGLRRAGERAEQSGAGRSRAGRTRPGEDAGRRPEPRSRRRRGQARPAAPRRARRYRAASVVFAPGVGGPRDYERPRRPRTTSTRRRGPLRTAGAAVRCRSPTSPPSSPGSRCSAARLLLVAVLLQGP